MEIHSNAVWKNLYRLYVIPHYHPTSWFDWLRELEIKVKLATIVEGDPKAPFSIATTPRCRGGHYSIPIYSYWNKLATLIEGDLNRASTPRCSGGCYSILWIAPLYPWSILYTAECKARRHQVPFLSLWYNSIWDWTLVTWIIGEHSIH